MAKKICRILWVVLFAGVIAVTCYVFTENQGPTVPTIIIAIILVLTVWFY
jgi:hypothetical protein